LIPVHTCVVIDAQDEFFRDDYEMPRMNGRDVAWARRGAGMSKCGVGMILVCAVILSAYGQTSSKFQPGTVTTATDKGEER
jgi:hypothetical protein